MSKVSVITWPEWQAHELYWGTKYGSGSTCNTVAEIREAADYIIQLAERIKAARATATMDDAATAAWPLR